MQRELDELPARMEQLEQEIEVLQAKVSDGDFYNQPQEAVNITLQLLASTEQDLERCFERWEELESLK